MSRRDWGWSAHWSPIAAPKQQQGYLQAWIRKARVFSLEGCTRMRRRIDWKCSETRWSWLWGSRFAKQWLSKWSVPKKRRSNWYLWFVSQKGWIFRARRPANSSPTPYRYWSRLRKGCWICSGWGARPSLPCQKLQSIAIQCLHIYHSTQFKVVCLYISSVFGQKAETDHYPTCILLEETQQQRYCTERIQRKRLDPKHKIRTWLALEAVQCWIETILPSEIPGTLLKGRG